MFQKLKTKNKTKTVNRWGSQLFHCKWQDDSYVNAAAIRELKNENDAAFRNMTMTKHKEFRGKIVKEYGTNPSRQNVMAWFQTNARRHNPEHFFVHEKLEAMHTQALHEETVYNANRRLRPGEPLFKTHKGVMDRFKSATH